MAEFYCGFTGATPHTTIPNWIITQRADNGSIIESNTFNGQEIVQKLHKGLTWDFDLESGDCCSPNSRLKVGPVNSSQNGSSYQCMFVTAFGMVISTIGTMTVVGKTM